MINFLYTYVFNFGWRGWANRCVSKRSNIPVRFKSCIISHEQQDASTSTLANPTWVTWTQESNVRYEMKTTGCTMLVSKLRGVSAPHTRVTDVTRKLPSHHPWQPPPSATSSSNPEITVFTGLPPLRMSRLVLLIFQPQKRGVEVVSQNRKTEIHISFI